MNYLKKAFMLFLILGCSLSFNLTEAIIFVEAEAKDEKDKYTHKKNLYKKVSKYIPYRPNQTITPRYLSNKNTFNEIVKARYEIIIARNAIMEETRKVIEILKKENFIKKLNFKNVLEYFKNSKLQPFTRSRQTQHKQ